MLSFDTITHTYPGKENLETIQLAPFGLEELKPLFPVPKEVLGYHLAGVDGMFRDAEWFLDSEVYCPEAFCWGIYHTEADPTSMIGTVNLQINTTSRSQAPWEQPRPLQDISVTILNKAFQGKGYGSAAVRAAVTYAFTHQATRVVSALIHPGNISSLRTFEKVGFTHLNDYTEPRRFVNGDTQALQEWSLVIPDTLSLLYDSGAPEIDILKEGYSRYQRQLARMTLTVS